jgi:uncharacterized membrane protein YkgB
MENLMEKSVSKNHGYQEGNIVGSMIGLLIGIVLVFGAVLPTATDTISNAGLTGSNATMANITITLVILLPMAWIGNMFGG